MIIFFRLFKNNDRLTTKVGDVRKSVQHAVKLTELESLSGERNSHAESLDGKHGGARNDNTESEIAASLASVIEKAARRVLENEKHKRQSKKDVNERLRLLFK